LKKFSKEFTFSEKFKLFSDLIRGIFSGKKEMKKYGLDEFDLQKVPDKKMIEKLIISVKKRYPSFYKVLIEDRNKYMAKNLAYIMHNNPKSKIVAVVGAGHGKEMLELVKKELKLFKRHK
jgi:pheromone shutdown protein TraB